MFELIFSSVWSTGTEFGFFTTERKFFILVKKIGALPRYQSIIDPFNIDVWVAVFVAVVVLWLTLIVYSKSGFYDERSFFNMMRVAMCALLAEDIPARLLALNQKEQRTIGIKILLMTWLPMTAMIVMAYQSNLLASLVRSSQEKPIDTFQDILDLDLTFYLYQRTMTPNLLANSPFPIVREVYQKAVVEKNGFFDMDKERKLLDKILAATMKGKSVVDGADVNFHEFTHLVRKGKHLTHATFPSGFYFAINHPLLNKAKIALRHLFEGGIYHKLHKEFLWLGSKKGRDYERNKDVPPLASPLNLENMMPIGLVTGTLAVLACFFFVAERFLKKKSNHNHEAQN